MIALKKPMVWSVATMMMTILHHLYGAIIYDEPFRLHVAIFAIPVIAVLLATYSRSLKSRHVAVKNISLTIFLLVSSVFSVFAIGLYEGGFNHIVKNILYFGGMSNETLDDIYPSVYELPDDAFFELTGISQFATGVLCGYEIFRVPVRRWFEILNDPTWPKSQ